MIYHRPTAKIIYFNVFFLFLLVSGFRLSAQTDIAAGKTLFSNNCASCHNPIKDGTGPALQGVTQRVPDKAKLHAWIRNNAAVLASGDPYFVGLFNSRNKTPMNPFPSLTDADIENILAYVETYKAPVPVIGDPGDPNGKQNESSSSKKIIIFSH